jgi:nucleoside-diphosphate-sugar epimerase
MVERLIGEGFWVRAVDLKAPDFSKSSANEFFLGDLRDVQVVRESLEIANDFDEIYQFAADMGGAGFVFTGENDADIMHNSAVINLNLLEEIRKRNSNRKENKTKVFYSSSACMYPEYNQLDPLNPICSEDSAYPASPDSEYGWEKLFSERLYLAYNRNHRIKVAIARYHNIFGPFGTWEGGREKAPAAICRKIASISESEGEIEIWGDGEQTRSFLYIDECLDATRRLMKSNFLGPVNIGSEEMVTINQMVKIVSKIANKKINTIHILDAPTGVRGRNSDNRLIRQKLGWDYSMTLEEGLERTYNWIADQVNSAKSKVKK